MKLTENISSVTTKLMGALNGMDLVKVNEIFGQFETCFDNLDVTSKLTDDWGRSRGLNQRERLASGREVAQRG